MILITDKKVVVAGQIAFGRPRCRWFGAQHGITLNVLSPRSFSIFFPPLKVDRHGVISSRREWRAGASRYSSITHRPAEQFDLHAAAMKVTLLILPDPSDRVSYSICLCK